MSDKHVTVLLKSLDYSYLVTALRGLAGQPCHRSNCGTVCLCNSCAARRVLPLVEAQGPVSADERRRRQSEGQKLACAVQGIDIESEAFKEAVRSAVDAIANHS